MLGQHVALGQHQLQLDGWTADELYTPNARITDINTSRCPKGRWCVHAVETLHANLPSLHAAKRKIPRLCMCSFAAANPGGLHANTLQHGGSFGKLHTVYILQASKNFHLQIRTGKAGRAAIAKALRARCCSGERIGPRRRKSLAQKLLGA